MLIQHILWTALIFVCSLSHAQNYQTVHVGDRVNVLSPISLEIIPVHVYQELDQHVEDVVRSYLPMEIQRQFFSYELTIILEKNAQAEGVFYPPGTHPRFKTAPRELVITLDPSLLSSVQKKRLLTHELFHAIHFALNPQEKGWVREGLAQLFEYQVHGTYNFNQVGQALEYSTTSLMGEFSIEENQSELYGHTFSYFLFLQDKCWGSSQGQWEIAQKGLEIALKELHSSKSFCQNVKTSADAFTIARIVNHHSRHEETFLLDHVSRMSPNTHFEREFNRLSSSQKLGIVRKLPIYLPVLVSGSKFKGLFSEELVQKSRSEGVEFLIIDGVPPYDVRKLTKIPLRPHQNILFFKSLTP